MRGRHLFGFFTAVAVIVQLTGCRDTPNNPTEPSPPSVPSLEIVDGSHNSGNPHFFFLPPLVTNPNVTGTFDSTESPTVTVCQLSGTTCGTTIAQFSMTSGTGSEVIRVDVPNQLYIVNWDTGECITGPCTLDPTQTYRLQVLAAGTELGHADVQVVVNQEQAKNVATGAAITLVNGRTLPVKFRIEQGAVFVVGPGTGPQTIQTPTTASGSSVTLVIPAGALTQSIGITVNPTTPPVGTNTTALVAGTVYDFGPTGTTFANPLTITIQYNPANIPTPAAERTLRLFALVNGAWVLVPGSTVNAMTHAVTGPARHFSTYGVNSSASVNAGGLSSCGIGTIGVPSVCWGANYAGQLGVGSTTGPQVCGPSGATFACSTSPTPLSIGDTFVSLSAGSEHSCGVLVGGAANCWGANQVGQLGDGTLTGSSSPVAVQGGHTFVMVSVGGDSGTTCGVTSSSDAYCWGFGPLGNGTSFSRTPVLVSGGLSFKVVSVGAGHACGLTIAGVVYCWGLNFFGQLGDGTTIPRPTPVAVASGQTFNSVSVGTFHSCAATGAGGSGSVFCWGANYVGQLGVDTFAFQQCGSPGNTVLCSTTPLAVVGGPAIGFIDVSAGAEHTCATTDGGSAYCWGRNDSGQLGDGTITGPQTCLAFGTPIACSLTPIAVSGGLTLGAVSAGRSHTCGISTAPFMNTAYCWGSNFAGQLGNGTTMDSSTPVQVSTLP